MTSRGPAGPHRGQSLLGADRAGGAERTERRSTPMATDTNATMGTCGIVLASTDPEELTRWYRSALEPLGARWDEHMLVLGGMYLGFDSRDDIAASPAEPGRVLLNVTVRDIRAAERHLNSLGVRWI